MLVFYVLLFIEYTIRTIFTFIHFIEIFTTYRQQGSDLARCCISSDLLTPARGKNLSSGPVRT